MSRIAPRLGLGLFDDRLTSEALVATGSGTLESAYTQAGQQPGHPEPVVGSTWRPHALQAQSVDLTVRAARGGYPGRDGAGILVAPSPVSSTSPYRSWDEPNLVTGWTSATDGTTWGASQAWTRIAATVIPSTGLIVIVAHDASRNGQTWSYQPRTGTWTTLYDWDAGALDGLPDLIGLTYDTVAERLILYTGSEAELTTTGHIAYYSDDGGTTWAVYSRGWAPGLGTLGSQIAWRPVAHPTGDWLMLRIAGAGAGATSEQLASSDQGVTWEQIGGAVIPGLYPWPVLGPLGFVVVEIDSVSFGLACRIISSARSYLDEAAQIIIEDTRNYSTVWAATDADGTIYVYALGESGGAATLDRCYVFRSIDGGLTWAEYTWLAWEMSSQTRYPDVHACVASSGQVHAVHTQIGDTGTDGTVAVTSFGGWSSVAQGPGADDLTRTDRTAWGYHGTDTYGALWLPWAAPENLAWTATTSTGTRTFSATSDAGLELTTTAGQGEVYRYGYGTTANYCSGIACLRVAASGSATLAGIGTGTPGVHVRPTLRSTGVYGYDTIIDVGSDGIRVRDGSTTRASVSVDTTAAPIWLRWHCTKGNAWVWYRTSTSTRWIVLADGVTITDAGAGTATTDRLIWGQDTGAVGHAVWRLVAGSVWADAQQGVVSSLTSIADTAATSVLAHQFGRSLPGQGGAYPYPDGTSSSEVLCLLSASGRTRQGESASLPTTYVRGVDQLHPIESPSPRVTWEATDTTAVRLVYDLGDESWVGGALCLVALRADAATIVLSSDDGAGGATTLGTLTKSWDVDYTLAGDTLYPSGTDALDDGRYFGEGELVGGYVQLPTSGADVARRIVAQSAGYWPGSSTQQAIRIRLEGLDGTEDATGSCVVVHHSGVLVVYPTSDTTPRRYLRITIAAAGVVPDDRYAAGILAIGRVVGLGQTPDWGVSRQQALSRAVRRRADGVPSIRELGPPRRIASYPLGTSLLLEMRSAASTPAYVGSSTGVPIGTGHDAWSAAAGYVEHALASGLVPCLLLSNLPDADGTITDPTMYLYGLATSDGISTTQTGGTEGVDEALTVGTLTIEEIR